jgi:hypothetical protein
MLRLRLEVQPYANVNEVCAQSTRIATLLGIEVVFEFSCKDLIAKPGMNADNLLHECQAESKTEEKSGTDTPAQIPGKGKEVSKPKKENTPGKKEPTPDTPKKDVQQEAI